MTGAHDDMEAADRPAIPSRPQIHSEFDAEFDFSFRPDTYWGPEGEPLDSDTDFAEDEHLTDEERVQRGRIHPSAMGGLYLPPREPGEVEIARIDLQSVTADAIQVRAQPDREGIRYRVVDEYEADRGHPLITPIERSDLPLMMGELIDLIDGTREEEGSRFIGLTDASRDNNIGFLETEDELAELLTFVNADSAFYPELFSYYDKRAEKWLAERITELREALAAGTWPAWHEEMLPYLTPDEQRAKGVETVQRICDVMRERGGQFTETILTFATFDERTKFFDDLPDPRQTWTDDESVPGLSYLPDGRIIGGAYLDWVIYEPARV